VVAALFAARSLTARPNATRDGDEVEAAKRKRALERARLRGKIRRAKRRAEIRAAAAASASAAALRLLSPSILARLFGARPDAEQLRELTADLTKHLQAQMEQEEEERSSSEEDALAAAARGEGEGGSGDDPLAEEDVENLSLSSDSEEEREAMEAKRAALADEAMGAMRSEAAAARRKRARFDVDEARAELRWVNVEMAYINEALIRLDAYVRAAFVQHAERARGESAKQVELVERLEELTRLREDTRRAERELAQVRMEAAANA
jgi:hypothetical protein